MAYALRREFLAFTRVFGVAGCSAPYTTYLHISHSSWLPDSLNWGPKKPTGQLHHCALGWSGPQSQTSGETGTARCDIASWCIADIVACRPAITLGSCCSISCLFCLLILIVCWLFLISWCQQPVPCAKGINCVACVRSAQFCVSHLLLLVPSTSACTGSVCT